MFLVPLKFVFNFSRFKPALSQLKPVLGDFRRGLNSLNSDTGFIFSKLKTPLVCKF